MGKVEYIECDNCGERIGDLNRDGGCLLNSYQAGAVFDAAYYFHKKCWTELKRGFLINHGN